MTSRTPVNMTAFLHDMLKNMHTGELRFADEWEDMYGSVMDNSNATYSHISPLLNFTDAWMSDEDSTWQNFEGLGYFSKRAMILGTILCITTAFGIMANFIMVFIIARSKSTRASAMNILLLNLVCACLLFLIVGIPSLLVENVFGHGWKFGQTFCQVHRYLIYATFYIISYAIVMILLYQMANLVAPDRLQPLDTPCTGLIVSSVMWCVILLANIPNYMGHGVSDFAGYTWCYHTEISNDITKVRTWTITQFIFSFALPLLLMYVLSITIMCLLLNAPSGSYDRLTNDSRRKRELASLVLAVTTVFALCWTPDKIISVYLHFISGVVELKLLIVSDIAMCLAYANPSLNPAIYIIFSTDFRRSLAAQFQSCRRRRIIERTQDTDEPSMVTKV